MQSIENLKTEINQRLDQLSAFMNMVATLETATLEPKRGPGRPRGAATSPEKAKRPITAARAKSMKIQGVYLGLLRGLKKTDAKRIKAKAIAAKDGVAKAIAFLRK